MSDWIIISMFVSLVIGILLTSTKAMLLKWIPSLVSTIIAGLVLLANLAFSILLYSEVKTNGEYASSFVDYLGADEFSAILLLLVSFTMLLIGLYSFFYIDEPRQATYFSFYFLLTVGLQAVLLTQHLFVLFISWELMVIVGYALVVFEKNGEALEAGFKYLVLSSLGSLFMLFGIGLTTALVPDLTFATILAQNGLLDSIVGRMAFGFLLIGFGFTGGILFLNQWLPDAHPAAPAPISAVLSGLLVKAGIYGMYRVFALFAPGNTFASNESQLVMLLAVLTMTEGNVMVIAQLLRKDIIDIKRILAYSSTVHLGFLMLVVVNTSELSQLALIFHITNHAMAKSLLFLLSGWFVHYYHTRDLTVLRGIGRQDKVLGVVLFIGFMSLAGLPGTGGFISKLLILASVYFQYIASGLDPFALTILLAAVINSAFAFGGYLWVIKYLIFDPAPEDQELHSNRMMKTIYSIFAVIILLLGILPMLFLSEVQGVL